MTVQALGINLRDSFKVKSIKRKMESENREKGNERRKTENKNNQKVKKPTWQGRGNLMWLWGRSLT